MFSDLRSHVWAYPALEVVHILGIGLLIGNLVLVELVILGRLSTEVLKPVVRLGLCLVVTGFLLSVASGSLMIASQPAELLANRAFLFKMMLLILAGCNAVWFHLRGSLEEVDGLGKAQLFLSVCIWVAIVSCGRWIAYI